MLPTVLSSYPPVVEVELAGGSCVVEDEDDVEEGAGSLVVLDGSVSTGSSGSVITGSSSAVVVGASVVSTGSGSVVEVVVSTGSNGSASVVSVLVVVVGFEPDVDGSVEGGGTTDEAGSLLSTGTVVVGRFSVVVMSSAVVSSLPPSTQEGFGSGLVGISVLVLSASSVDASVRATLTDGPRVASVLGGSGVAVVGAEVDSTAAACVPVGAEELGAGSSWGSASTSTMTTGACVVVVDSVVVDSTVVPLTVTRELSVLLPTNCTIGLPWTTSA